MSFAVAKSANLSIYEWRLEQAVQRNAHIPEDLAKTGELNLNRREINVEVGRLYLLNNAINLETTMLDTPEEFWEGMFSYWCLVIFEWHSFNVFILFIITQTIVSNPNTKEL